MGHFYRVEQRTLLTSFDTEYCLFARFDADKTYAKLVIARSDWLIVWVSQRLVQKNLVGNAFTSSNTT